MENFINHMIFVCFALVAVGLIFLLFGVLFEFITKKIDPRFKNKIEKLLSEDEDEED